MEISRGCLRDIDCVRYNNDSNSIVNDSSVYLNFQVCRSSMMFGPPTRNWTANVCTCKASMLVANPRDDNSCTLLDAGGIFFVTIDVFVILSLLLLLVYCLHTLYISSTYLAKRRERLLQQQQQHQEQQHTIYYYLYCQCFKSCIISKANFRLPKLKKKSTSPATNVPYKPTGRTKQDAELCLFLLSTALAFIVISTLLTLIRVVAPSKVLVNRYHLRIGQQIHPFTFAEYITFCLFLIFMIMCVLQLNIGWIDTSDMIRDLDNRPKKFRQMQKIYKGAAYALEACMLITTFILIGFNLLPEAQIFLALLSFISIISVMTGSWYVVGSLRSLSKLAESQKRDALAARMSPINLDAQLLNDKADEIDSFNSRIKRYGLISLIFFYPAILLRVLSYDATRTSFENYNSWLFRVSAISMILLCNEIRKYLTKLILQTTQAKKETGVTSIASSDPKSPFERYVKRVLKNDVSPINNGNKNKKGAIRAYTESEERPEGESVDNRELSELDMGGGAIELFRVPNDKVQQPSKMYEGTEVEGGYTVGEYTYNDKTVSNVPT